MKICPQCSIKYPDVLDFCPQDGAALPNAAGQRPTQALYDALIGTTVDGRYMIEAKLGEGGMGLVYAARHVIIDKRVAMKVLKAEANEDPTAGQRFIQEAKSASKIRHANIVDITDFGQLTDGSAYFVMEYCEGPTLGDAIRQGPLSAARCITVAAQMARGLKAAHDQGIIHRDLKPENVFLLEREGEADFVKIVDFGIAKISGANLGMATSRLTQAGMVLGTPEYMSPEQATGKETDHRVDEYALGCMMYEMLTGDVPYRGESSAGTLTKHVFDPIVPPRKARPDLNIPPTLDEVVVKAMAKSAGERYASMKDLLDALDGAAGEIDSGRDAERSMKLVVEQSRVTATPSELVAEEQLGQIERPGVSKMPIVIGVALGVLLLGGVGAWSVLKSGGDAAAKKEPLAVVPVKPVEPQHPVVPPPVAPSKIEITLRSTPDGADIYQDGKPIGSSPWVAAMPPGNHTVEITFKMAGYQDHSEKIVPDRNQVVAVALAPAAQQHSSHGGSHDHGRHELPKAPPTDNGKPSHQATPRNDLRDPFSDP